MHFQPLLNKYHINTTIEILLAAWCEPHRHFHNQLHLDDLIRQIEEAHTAGTIDDHQKEKLLLTALFHDIIYDPLKDDNEERSADYFLSHCTEKSNPDILDIRYAIIDTKTHASATPLAQQFNRFDMNIIERNLDELKRWEAGIYGEYKIFGNALYKAGRLQFLQTLPNKYPNNKENLLQLIEFVKTTYT